MKISAWVALLAAVAIVGCASIAELGGVTVQSFDAGAPPKPPGCAIEVIRQRPTRPYQALGLIRSHLTTVPNAGAVTVTFPKACELGADAVIVERDQVLNEFEHKLVAVTAIRWVTPEVQPEPAPAAVPTPEPGPVTITTTITTTTTDGRTRTTTTTTITTRTPAPEPAPATTTTP